MLSHLIYDVGRNDKKTMEEMVIALDDEVERNAFEEEEGKDVTSEVGQDEMDILQSYDDDKGKEIGDEEVTDRKKKRFAALVFLYNAAIHIFQTILLAGLTITVNVAPDLELPGLFLGGAQAF